MLVSAVQISPWAPLPFKAIKDIGVLRRWDSLVLVLSFLRLLQDILSESLPAHTFRISRHFFQRIPSAHGHDFVIAMAIFRKLTAAKLRDP